MARTNLSRLSPKQRLNINTFISVKRGWRENENVRYVRRVSCAVTDEQVCSGLWWINPEHCTWPLTWNSSQVIQRFSLPDAYWRIYGMNRPQHLFTAGPLHSRWSPTLRRETKSFFISRINCLKGYWGKMRKWNDSGSTDNVVILGHTLVMIMDSAVCHNLLYIS